MGPLNTRGRSKAGGFDPPHALKDRPCSSDSWKQNWARFSFIIPSLSVSRSLSLPPSLLPPPQPVSVSLFLFLCVAVSVPEMTLCGQRSTGRQSPRTLSLSPCPSPKPSVNFRLKPSADESLISRVVVCDTLAFIVWRLRVCDGRQQNVVDTRAVGVSESLDLLGNLLHVCWCSYANVHSCTDIYADDVFLAALPMLRYGWNELDSCDGQTPDWPPACPQCLVTCPRCHFTATLSCSAPRWGTTDAEMKVPSAENPEAAIKIFPSKAWIRSK